MTRGRVFIERLEGGRESVQNPYFLSPRASSKRGEGLCGAA